MEKPIFTHDCDNCVYLGAFNGHDLYVCNRISGVTSMTSVLARYGNDGPQYGSGLINGMSPALIPELGEAKRRANEKGYR